MPTTITPALLSDAAALADLAALTFPLACPAGIPEAALATFIAEELSAQRFRAHLADPLRSLYVARESDGVAGYLMLARQECPPVALAAAHPMYLQRLYVRPEFHGLGLAGAFLGLARRLARADGHDALWLTTGSFNARAVAFYRREGFSVVGETIFQVGSDPQHDHVMLLRIWN
jgi:tRNA (guanine37-N1)-methyltransferase